MPDCRHSFSLRTLRFSLGLALSMGAAAQGPCLDLSPNDDYVDGSSTDPGAEVAVRITNGPTPLTVEYIEIFTGETDSEGRLSIRSHDSSRNRPGPLLSGGSWRIDPINSWQGGALDSAVTLQPGETFWVSKFIPTRHQSNIERRNNNAGDVMMWSRDDGQNWAGPFDDVEYKIRLFCHTPAKVDYFGLGCGGSTGRGPDTTFYERFDTAENPLDLGSSVRFSPNGSGWTVALGQDSFEPNVSGPLTFVDDDDLAYGLPLGFDFPLQGGGDTNSIDVGAHGLICLISDPLNESWVWTEPDFFGSGAPRIAAYERGLSPSSGGQIYFHTAPGVAYITWLDVPQEDGSGSLTFQLQLYPSGEFVIAYGNLSAGDGAVGYSAGGVQGLTANDITDPQSAPPRLAVGALPQPGNALPVQVLDLPARTTLTTLGVGFLRFDPAIDLTPLGMPRCQLQTRADVLLSTTQAGSSAQTLVPIPNDPTLLRLRVYLQANSIVTGANRLNLALSDTARLTIGQ